MIALNQEVTAHRITANTILYHLLIFKEETINSATYVPIK